MSSSHLKQPFQYEKIPLDFLKSQKKKRAKDTTGTIKRLAMYLVKEKWALFAVILMVFLSSSLGLLGPYLVGMAIDDFIVSKQTAGLALLIILLIIIYLFHSLSIFL